MWMNFAQANEPEELPEHLDPAIVQLLTNRYGDGLVYLRGEDEPGAYERAMNMGLISREGYLTPRGRSLIARLQRD